MATDAATAWAEAKPQVFWLDPQIDRHLLPDPRHPLDGDVITDLAVVGGGFSGLWAALIAKERWPERAVVLAEARTVGWAGSGRNGGFCSTSLTHGFGNGLARWPGEINELERLGRQNLDEIEAAVRRYGIDCDFERTGELSLATEPWQVDELAEEVTEMRRLGFEAELLDAQQVRAEVDSPTYLAGMTVPGTVAMLHPGKLAHGLRQACLDAGVQIYEHTPVRGIKGEHDRLRLSCPNGSIVARDVVWGTGAFRGPLRRLRHYLLPVYDYVLVSEPLADHQLAAIGWKGRQGLADAGNQFHYYRLTSDNRILWGGYDAVHHFGSRIKPEFDQRPETFQRLAEHFFVTFPQLKGLRFSHRWGGVIDTCSRFSPFFGTAYRGRLAYAAGYTGLGVGATRFGAEVMLDLVTGAETDRTTLEMVRTKPMPFPPEPFRSLGVTLTVRSLAAADRNGGRRNLWLRTLDRLGLGFDS
jgi:glycine/D-amino acid oxidase-like deaminating enzyme